MKIVGFRGWDVQGDKLYPQTWKINPWPKFGNSKAVHEYYWISHHKYGDKPSRKRVQEHSAPHKGCNCGWNANYTVLFPIKYPKNRVYGAMVGWGKIFRHEKGFRAEYAKIIAVVPGPSITTPLLEKYNIPLVSEENLIFYASEYGEIISV